MESIDAVISNSNIKSLTERQKSKNETVSRKKLFYSKRLAYYAQIKPKTAALPSFAEPASLQLPPIKESKKSSTTRKKKYANLEHPTIDDAAYLKENLFEITKDRRGIDLSDRIRGLSRHHRMGAVLEKVFSDKPKEPIDPTTPQNENTKETALFDPLIKPETPNIQNIISIVKGKTPDEATARQEEFENEKMVHLIRRLHKSIPRPQLAQKSVPASAKPEPTRTSHGANNNINAQEFDLPDLKAYLYGSVGNGGSENTPKPRKLMSPFKNYEPQPLSLTEGTEKECFTKIETETLRPQQISTDKHDKERKPDVINLSKVLDSKNKVDVEDFETDVSSFVMAGSVKEMNPHLHVERHLKKQPLYSQKRHKIVVQLAKQVSEAPPQVQPHTKLEPLNQRQRHFLQIKASVPIGKLIDYSILGEVHQLKEREFTRKVNIVTRERINEEIAKEYSRRRKINKRLNPPLQ